MITTSRIRMKLNKDDSHDDGTKEATVENKPQAPSTSKPTISKTVQNQQVHDNNMTIEMMIVKKK